MQFPIDCLSSTVKTGSNELAPPLPYLISEDSYCFPQEKVKDHLYDIYGKTSVNQRLIIIFGAISPNIQAKEKCCLFQKECISKHMSIHLLIKFPKTVSILAEKIRFLEAVTYYLYSLSPHTEDNERILHNFIRGFVNWYADKLYNGDIVTTANAVIALLEKHLKVVFKELSQESFDIKKLIRDAIVTSYPMTENDVSLLKRTSDTQEGQKIAVIRLIYRNVMARPENKPNSMKIAEQLGNEKEYLKTLGTEEGCSHLELITQQAGLPLEEILTNQSAFETITQSGTILFLLFHFFRTFPTEDKIKPLLSINIARAFLRMLCQTQHTLSSPKELALYFADLCKRYFLDEKFKYEVLNIAQYEEELLFQSTTEKEKNVITYLEEEYSSFFLTKKNLDDLFKYAQHLRNLDPNKNPDEIQNFLNTNRTSIMEIIKNKEALVSLCKVKVWRKYVSKLLAQSSQNDQDLQLGIIKTNFARYLFDFFCRSREEYEINKHSIGFYLSKYSLQLSALISDPRVPENASFVAIKRNSFYEEIQQQASPQSSSLANQSGLSSVYSEDDPNLQSFAH